MPDTLQKLDYLTMYLRGTSGAGASASFNNASATGFTVSGQFQLVATGGQPDPADSSPCSFFLTPTTRSGIRSGSNYLTDFDFSYPTYRLNHSKTNLDKSGYRPQVRRSVDELFPDR